MVVILNALFHATKGVMLYVPTIVIKVAQAAIRLTVTNLIV